MDKSLVNCDVVGQQLTVGFQGKDSFKTKCGGVLSILVRMTVTLYAAVKVFDLVKRNNPTITTITKQIDPRDYPAVNLGKNGIWFMASVYERNKLDNTFHPVKIPERIGEFNMDNSESSSV